MRIYTKVLKILFIVVTVLSFCLSLFVGVSTSFKLVFKDDLSIRQRIYLNTKGYLDEAEDKNILNFNYTYYDGDTYVEETVGCYKAKKGVECAWIQKLYSVNKNNKKTLTKTSFTKGDGFLYSNDGTNKERTIYTGTSIADMNDDLLSIFKNTSAYVADFTSDSDNRYVEYDTSMKFHFNTFKLDKKISYVAIDNYVKRRVTFTVDSKDRVTKIKTSDNITITFNYNNTKIKLPSTDGYVAA